MIEKNSILSGGSSSSSTQNAKEPAASPHRPVRQVWVDPLLASMGNLSPQHASSVPPRTGTLPAASSTAATAGHSPSSTSTERSASPVPVTYPPFQPPPKQAHQAAVQAVQRLEDPASHQFWASLEFDDHPHHNNHWWSSLEVLLKYQENYPTTPESIAPDAIRPEPGPDLDFTVLVDPTDSATPELHQPLPAFGALEYPSTDLSELDAETLDASPQKDLSDERLCQALANSNSAYKDLEELTKDLRQSCLRSYEQWLCTKQDDPHAKAQTSGIQHHVAQGLLLWKRITLTRAGLQQIQDTDIPSRVLSELKIASERRLRYFFIDPHPLPLFEAHLKSLQDLLPVPADPQDTDPKWQTIKELRHTVETLRMDLLSPELQGAKQHSGPSFKSVLEAPPLAPHPKNSDQSLEKTPQQPLLRDITQVPAKKIASTNARALTTRPQKTQVPAKPQPSKRQSHPASSSRSAAEKTDIRGKAPAVPKAKPQPQPMAQRYSEPNSTQPARFIETPEANELADTLASQLWIKQETQAQLDRDTRAREAEEFFMQVAAILTPLQDTARELDNTAKKETSLLLALDAWEKSINAHNACLAELNTQLATINNKSPRTPKLHVLIKEIRSAARQPEAHATEFINQVMDSMLAATVRISKGSSASESSSTEPSTLKQVLLHCQLVLEQLSASKLTRLHPPPPALSKCITNGITLCTMLPRILEASAPYPDSSHDILARANNLQDAKNSLEVISKSTESNSIKSLQSLNELCTQRNNDCLMAAAKLSSEEAVEHSIFLFGELQSEAEASQVPSYKYHHLITDPIHKIEQKKPPSQIILTQQKKLPRAPKSSSINQ